MHIDLMAMNVVCMESICLLCWASRGVEHSRKQLTVGGLAGVRAYYRGRWALWAVQYVGCKVQLIKKRDASVGQYARGRLQ